MSLTKAEYEKYIVPIITRQVVYDRFIDADFPEFKKEVKESISELGQTVVSVGKKVEEVVSNGLSGKIANIEEKLDKHLNEITSDKERIVELEKEREGGWKDIRKSKWQELTMVKKIGIVSALGTFLVTFSYQISTLLTWLADIIANLNK